MRVKCGAAGKEKDAGADASDGRTDGRTDGWRKQGGRKGIIEFRATSEEEGEFGRAGIQFPSLPKQRSSSAM